VKEGWKKEKLRNSKDISGVFLKKKKKERDRSDPSATHVFISKL